MLAGAVSAAVGLGRRHWGPRRVRQRNELDARPPLIRLGEQLHQVVDLARDDLAHGEAKVAELFDLQRMVVRPLTRAELRREALGVRLGPSTAFGSMTISSAARAMSVPPDIA